jgi:Mg-chelatase subunit ChlD
MTDDLAPARAALARNRTQGQTALRDAVTLSLTLAGRREARRLVLLFTDGHGTPLRSRWPIQEKAAALCR